jgi:hypothetical protein
MSSGSFLPIFEGPYFLYRQSQEVKRLSHYDLSKRRSGVTNQKA